MASVVGVVSVLVALITGVLGILKYFDLRSKRQQREGIGAAFKGIVTTLSGADRVERLGSAILLRRFFNPDSEYSKPDMPYADEAIDVIAATLRGEPTGDVQKVLGDGLAYVGERGLKHKDFQRVNLKGGYISLSGPAGHAVRPAHEKHVDRRRFRGRRTTTSTADGEEEIRPRLDVSHADFFEADISEASFTEDICLSTIFYNASAIGTVFRDADLTGADFRDADLRRARFDNAELLDAKFDGAKLDGARFVNAKNVPEHVAQHIDDRGVHKVFEQERVRRVFVSAPSVSMTSDRDVLRLAYTILRDEGFEPVSVQPEAYHADRHLSDVKEAMADCIGLVTVGLPQLTVVSGTWRRGTDDEVDLTDEILQTPWNDIETGIAVGLGLPVLSIRAGCGKFGVFGLDSQAAGFEQVDLVDSGTGEGLSDVIRSWVGRALPSHGVG